MITKNILLTTLIGWMAPVIEKFNDNPVPCSTIVISIDDDETEYQFDSKGALKELFGQSTAEFFSKGHMEIKLAGTHWKIGKDLVSMEMMEKNGDGFKIERIFKNGRGISEKSEGFEKGKVVLSSRSEFTYNADGDATSVMAENFIDGKKVQEMNSHLTYHEDKLSPFHGNPFQSIIEQDWSAAANTNKHLVKEIKYTLKKVDDPDMDVISIGTINYMYKFDEKGRIQSIVIIDSVTQEVHHSDGRKTSRPETNSKNIRFIYECN